MLSRTISQYSSRCVAKGQESVEQESRSQSSSSRNIRGRTKAYRSRASQVDRGKGAVNIKFSEPDVMSAAPTKANQELELFAEGALLMLFLYTAYFFFLLRRCIRQQVIPSHAHQNANGRIQGLKFNSCFSWTQVLSATWEGSSWKYIVRRVISLGRRFDFVLQGDGSLRAG